VLEEKTANDKQENGDLDSNSGTGTPPPAITASAQSVTSAQNPGSPPTAQSGEAFPPQLPTETPPRKAHASPPENSREMLQISRDTLEATEGLFRATVWGIVVAAAAAVIFWLQFKTMSYQTQILSSQAITGIANAIRSDSLVQQQIRQDQRAWLIATVDPIHWTGGSPIVFLGHITNTGKTPAQNVKLIASALFLSMNEIPEFVYTPGTGHPTSVAETPILFPNAPPLPFQVLAFKKGTKVGERIILSKEMLDQMNSGTYFVVTHGKISYNSFGVSHWQTFCNVFPSYVGTLKKPGDNIPPLIGACNKYADIDKNE
jgi:hypothetical protein